MCSCVLEFVISHGTQTIETHTRARTYAHRLTHSHKRTHTPFSFTHSPATVVTAQSSLTADRLSEALGWPRPRAAAALTALLQLGMAWLDEGAVYFFPSFCALTA